jgi:CopG family nickel-responsive transcriptional regulator
MPVVSVSLDPDSLKLLDRIQKANELSGRSEAVRVCLRSAEAEVRDRESMKGDVEGVLVVIHASHNEPQLESLKHEYQAVVTTQIHSHLKYQKCLEVFIVRGASSVVKEMLTKFQRDERMDYVKFLQS